MAAGAIVVISWVAAAPAMGADAQLADPPFCDPQLRPSSAIPFWASYTDYIQRRLSVTQSLQNIGTCQPCAVDVTSIETDSGVKVETPLPIDAGTIPAASTGAVTVKYQVPPGINRFRARLFAQCRPVTPPPPPVSASYVMYIAPLHAFAMEGCPTFAPVPPEEQYGPKRFTVRVLDLEGNPAPDRPVSWTLTDPLRFRIDAAGSSFQTDAAGLAYVTVLPPFFKFLSSYDQGSTRVIAATAAADPVQATFDYVRCDFSGPGPIPPGPGPAS